MSPARNSHRLLRSSQAAGTALLLLGELGLLVSPAMAGDILRGGRAGAAPQGAANPVGTTPPPIVPAGGTTRDSLARTAMAIQSVQAMQLAARNVANNGNHANTNPSGSGAVLPDVPDGLGTGGLQVDSRVTGPNSIFWKGANLPVQSTTSGGTTQVTVKQTAQQALLNWDTFNVGKNTTLTFDQTDGGSNVGQWIAFNFVNDPLANPTQILGNIEAKGQVYVMNRNGIVFGGKSQVNVHTLVASALPINTNLIDRGLLNNPDQQFLFSALSIPAGNDGMPAFDPGLPANTRIGDVVVEAGARLTAPTTADKVGGRIALVGANVTNNGSISTADGQTILAAGLQVGFDAHKSSDPSLRGLDTFIGAVADPASTLTAYAGTATNNGIIDSPRANITMTGKTVNQMGVITSTTSVSLNGRIDLLAQYDSVGNVAATAANATFGSFLPKSTGNVTFGQDSVTRILPELDSTEKVIGSTLALPSQVNVLGQNIHFDDNSILLAPSAKVNISAGTWFTVPTSTETSPPKLEFARDTGSINLDAGAVIDVSGSKNVASSVTSNIVRVELRGTELADSPLLRDGPLRGQTIYIDVTETGTYNGKTWVGTSLADVSGYVNLVQRTVGELTTAGGTVKLEAGNGVSIHDGATVDVSGGWVNYAGGVVQTSRVTADGKVFDIADATPDRVYDGLFRGGSLNVSRKWGTKEQYVNPLVNDGTRYQEGFTQGGSGGQLQIDSPTMALDGTLAGSVHVGERQREIRPQASVLTLRFTADQRLSTGNGVGECSPAPPVVRFSDTAAAQNLLGDTVLDSNGNPVGMSADRAVEVLLRSDILSQDAFGSLSIYNPDGEVVVEDGTTLTASPKGSIALEGANITVNGSLMAAGGSLSIVTQNFPLGFDLGNNLPTANAGRGTFTLGANATLSTAGLIVDDRPQSGSALQTPLATAGGSISIRSMSANLATGSVIDVSGGVRANETGRITYGNAGSLSILTGLDSNLSSVAGGSLVLGSTLRGYSGAKGGSLTLRAPALQIGGSDPGGNLLHLNADFFNQGGFSTFALSGIGSNGSDPNHPQPGVKIAAGTVISPVVSSWLANTQGETLTLGTYVKPEGQRTPVSLSFTATGLKNSFASNALISRGDAVLEEGAVINAGPGGSITLRGDTVSVQGSLLAAGGSIQVTGGNRNAFFAEGLAPSSTVWIGEHAVLDASGTTLLVPDALGRRRGVVLDGGSISVSGNIIAEAGAVLDVSGTSGTLDLLAGESGKSLTDISSGASGTTTSPYSRKTKATVVQSDGGTIKLTGEEMLLTDATLLGHAGGEQACGGTLQVSSGRFFPAGTITKPDFDTTLVVTGDGTVIPSTLDGGIAVTMPGDATGIVGGARFSADDFARGGFANLDMLGSVAFSGDVTIKADGRITAGNKAALQANGAVNLSASHISFGTPFQLPQTPEELAAFRFTNTLGAVYQPPTFGSGSLTMSAGLIDVGYVSLQGIGNANLIAENGDIRGSGTLAMAGNLGLKAGQIYPPTALNFTLAAYDYTEGGVSKKGSVTIEGSGTRRLPLSAGGTLSVYASTIHQNGTLRAPFGQINLGWDGSGTAPFDVLSGGNFTKTTELVVGSKSVTSVSAIDPLTGKGITIPYGISVNGNSWIDPRGIDITSGGLPQKSIKLSAESVTTEDGSVIDIRGGGDLYAYRWVQGTGGSQDILSNPNSFAVIPSYDASYAPYAPFSSSLASVPGGSGYTSSGVHIGDTIRLDGGGGLPAGTYTILPARYALLPGAYLVTALDGAAVGQVPKPDGSTVVSGYVYNGLEANRTVPNLATRFEVASAATVAARAEYTSFTANKFFTSTGGYRLPGDSGQIVFGATSSLTIDGNVLSAAPKDFRGGMIDISSPLDILITNGATAPVAGTLMLDSALLSGFGAESLLIGGVRSATSEGTVINVTAGDVTVDNAGSELSAQEVILVAKEHLQLADDSKIVQTGTGSGAANTYIIGSSTVAGSGNGALLRVASGAGSSLIRRGVTPGGAVSLSVGAGSILTGDSVMLDSTSLTLLDPTAKITTDALSISSGRISIALDPTVTPGADAGLVLSGATLAALSSADSLALASYSSLDLLGKGEIGGTDATGKPLIDSLALRAAEIRGIGVGTGEVSFNAKTILLDNQPGGTASAAGATSGSLAFHADSIQLGAGALAVRGFSQTTLVAKDEVRAVSSGSFSANGNLSIMAPVVLANGAVKHQISTTGNLLVSGNGGAGKAGAAGLGASLSFTGASVDVSTNVLLPSGEAILRATTGPLVVNSLIDAGGVARRFKDQTRYTDGGTIRLIADQGNVTLSETGELNVSAMPGGGNAGSIQIAASHGTVSLDKGKLAGAEGARGDGGSFSLDVGSMASLKALDTLLNQSSFSYSRDFRVRTGDVEVDGNAIAHSYSLSADAGSVTVTGSIDASGATGGSVRLVASNSMTLAGGSKIDASADDFDSAGKGGSIVLESRGAGGGKLNLASNSTIDLSVAATAGLGEFSGTLHLRAPRIGTTDLGIDHVSSTITGASHVIVEGYQTYDLTASGGAINSTVQNTVKTDATTFTGNAGAIETRILGELNDDAKVALGSILTVRPGAEIINTTGNLTLGGATTNGNTGDWNLSTFRFGAEQVPGILTLRAAGDLVFYNSLSDGFTSSAYNSGLLANNAGLADHVEAWSYRLVAGADFSAADTRKVFEVRMVDGSAMGTAPGSIKLGKNGFTGAVSGGNNALTSTPLSQTSNTGLFQVIRTGGGDIDVVAGGDVQLLNQFATIYTAGTQVADPTLGGTFETPRPAITTLESGALGAVQQPTPAPVQYTSGGGNVTISAGNDIIHLTRNASNQLIADSSRQTPNNWLYRRAAVDPVTGEFAASKFGEIASTTWWVDFTNFFEGIGALGGGNVTLDAGRDVTNVDALAPTNARMPKGKPDASKLVELGGGDVTVLAGRNIDGGVYYVERGHGSLSADGSIKTNSTRSPSLTILSTPNQVLDSTAWLPTTLFVGKSDFEVSAAGDVLLGPVANAFLVPQGYNNTMWYKTWFSTYSADSGVSVNSLGGSVTLRNSIANGSNQSVTAGLPALQAWMQAEQLLASGSASFSQPWLRLTESALAPLSVGFTLMPSNLEAVSFSGDVKMTGSISLSPAARGDLALLAAGSVKGLQPAGITTSLGTAYHVWDDTSINLSDADPTAVAGITNPIAYQNQFGITSSANIRRTQAGALSALERLFNETGSTNGVLQQKQNLHTSGLLHAGDTEPVRIYAGDGDISGLTLFSSKAARILAGQDIRDVAFYIQNLAEKDVSVVSAGRDIILYDNTTRDRLAAVVTGNLLTSNGGTESGDIQIAGPGTLEVFAGRNLDLGLGVNNADGTGTGITSIANGRNPYLTTEGASLIVAAGMGDAWSLDSSTADFPAFINKFIKDGEGDDHLKELDLTQDEFDALSEEEKRMVALQVFFFVLRDAGRDRNDPDAPGYGTYDAGKAAVATLFPEKGEWEGDINTRSRDIRTKSGGDITLLAPGGSLSLATSLSSGVLAPPGIITEAGGHINVFTHRNVDLGISRIFTLRGGDEIIWSSIGNIAAGSSSKTVQSAPPTRVLIDPQSADVKTDLAGLATGGGIGVLSTVAGVEPSDVDLIAPEGTIDAGDAGIRVSGNLNIAAAVVVNAGNISVGGSSAGSNPGAVAAPSVGSITSAANTSNAATTADPGQQNRQAEDASQQQVVEEPSLISVEVLGYGGSADDDEEDEEKDKEGSSETATP